MLPFELLKPASFDEAIQLLSLNRDNSKPIAGGTALMLMMKSQIQSWLTTATLVLYPSSTKETFQVLQAS